MAIVKDFYFHKTHIMIDDSCVVSKEEQEKIRKELGRIWTEAELGGRILPPEEVERRRKWREEHY